MFCSGGSTMPWRLTTTSSWTTTTISSVEPGRQPSSSQANSQHKLTSRSNLSGFRWFWIFWYFERNVPLQLPRHYSLPLPRSTILTFEKIHIDSVTNVPSNVSNIHTCRPSLLLSNKIHPFWSYLQNHQTCPQTSRIYRDGRRWLWSKTRRCR